MRLTAPLTSFSLSAAFSLITSTATAATHGPTIENPPDQESLPAPRIEGLKTRPVSEICEKSSTMNYAVHGEDLRKKWSSEPAYALSQSSDLRDLQKGIAYQMGRLYSGTKPPNEAPDLPKFLNDYERLYSIARRKRVNNEAYYLKRLNGSIDYYNRTSPTTEARVEWAAPVACGVNFSIGCARAFFDTVKMMSTFTYVGSVSLPDLIKEVSADYHYTEAALYLMRQLGENYDRAQRGIWKGGDLFTDVEKACRQTGVSNKRASEMAVNLLGLYGSRGPAMFPLLTLHNGLPAQPLYLTLAFMSSAIPYFDKISSKSGKIYSMPPTIRTSCRDSRPYHFWMAAYLAKELKKRGYNDKDSFDALHMMGSLYEEFGATSTNYGMLQNSREIDHVDNVESRKDILYNDLGAAWWLTNERGEAHTFDGDSYLRSMFIASNEAPPRIPKWAAPAIDAANALSKEKLKSYLNWRQRMGTDAGLNDIHSFLQK